MLEIQKFIQQNTDWETKLTKSPYDLIIKRKDNLILFKYTQGVSDFSYKIPNEARGLILEEGTWKVVKAAFWKFFNLWEEHAAQIDWASAQVTEKMDGTCVSLYWYDNEWKIGTNSNIDAHDSSLNIGGYKTYYDLCAAALRKYNVDFNKLNKNYTYTFELCSPYSRIVCKFNEIELYLILVRDNSTLDEIDIKSISKEIGVPTPKFFPIVSNNPEDFTNIVNSFNDNQEGIVVKDKFNNRVKIKSEQYFHIHHLINNHNFTRARAFDLIFKNDFEVLVYFPEYAEFFDNLKEELKAAQRRIEEIEIEVQLWKENNKNATKKDFRKFIEETKQPKEWKYYCWAFNGNITPPDTDDVYMLMKFYNLEK